MAFQGNVIVSSGEVPAEGGTYAPIQVDALVVGAGLSGITAIHRLRGAGLTVKCMEASGDFGGVWKFNR